LPQNLYFSLFSQAGTDMPPNIRRSATEAYDPKQRIVGGVVLFLLVLLIYSILKLLLGFSSVPEGEYVLSAPLKDEELPSEAAAQPDTQTQTPQFLPTAANNTPAPKKTTTYPHLPQEFVFLNLNGDPMQPENRLREPFAQAGKWYVQAASFKSETGAQRLAQKIRAKNIASETHIIRTSNGWYAVRLSPQNDHGMAKQQYRKLRRLLYLEPVIRKIN
jgi:hypothetical protein